MTFRMVMKTINRSLTILLLILTLIATLVVLRLMMYYDAMWPGNKCPTYQSVNAPSALRQPADDKPLFDYPADVPLEKLNPGSEFANDERYSDLKYNKLKEYHYRTLVYREKFSCRKLFHGDKVEQLKVTELHTKTGNNYTVTKNADVPAILADCEAFKRARDYRADTGTELEQNFPLAYVILVHMDFEHLERLLRSLYMPQHSFCIHVDDKAPDELKQAVTKLASCFNNVIVASEAQTIVYAHMSRLMADIVCMKDLLKLNSLWKYLLNYAATELPLRSNLETVEILQEFHGLNDIHEQFEKRVEERFLKEHKIINGRMRATDVQHSPPPYNLTIVKGQAYNAFSRKFLEWAFTDKKPLEFLQWCNKTYSPDEHFWATLNNLYHNPFLNSPGGFKGHPDKKGYITRFINWQYPNSHMKCNGKVIHHICIFSALDLPLFTSEPHQLAANKFDLTFDPIAYSCMEELIEAKSRSQLPFDLPRYKKLYFVWYKKS